MGRDSFLLSKNVAYGMLPPAENGRHALTQGYVDEASEATPLAAGPRGLAPGPHLEGRPWPAQKAHSP